MKKVLLFGSCGFVGHYLTQEFQTHGYQVVGSDIQWKDISGKSMPEQGTFYPADILCCDEVSKLIAQVKPDIIIDLAAISSVGLSWSIPQKTISVNVIGALNILEAAKNMEIMPKILFIGSSEEYETTDDPVSETTTLNANNPYGISKMMQEKFVEIYRQQYGMQVYYVRPFNHTGVGQADSFVLASFCKQAAEIEKAQKPGTIYVGNLSAKRDFSDVRDIVRAYRMIVEEADCTKVYNVGAGKAYSLKEMLEYIVSLSSQEITVEVDPKRYRPVDTPIVCCDNHLIQRELGWKPEFSIFDTLKEMYHFYLQVSG